MNFLDFLESWHMLHQAQSTLVLIVAFVIFRWALIVSIRRWQAPSSEDRRRWIVQIKNLSIFILFFGLIGIWSTELRAFALSMVAVAAAVAISTKEIIQCFLGGFYIASAKPFELGDRIEVHGVRGEVINHNLLSTTLLEMGPTREVNQLSGRQVVVPNSVFLSQSVHNQSIQQHYVLQTLRISLEEGEKWQDLEKILLNAANLECQSYLEPAMHSMRRLGQREGLDLPRVEPRVSFYYDDFGKLHLILRYPAPLERMSRVEQSIVRNLLTSRDGLAGART